MGAQSVTLGHYLTEGTEEVSVIVTDLRMLQLQPGRNCVEEVFQ